MKSLRFTALLWTTVVLGIVGVIAAAVSYESAWRETAEFMDRELRQIALNVGEGSAETPGAKGHRDPKAEVVIGVWNQPGQSPPPRRGPAPRPPPPKPGLST